MLSHPLPDREVTVELAAHLVESQFPRWAHLPITPVSSSGTVNTLFRLGNELVMRFPRSRGAIEFIDKERRWLPRMAPHLSLAIPVPVAEANPQSEYPWPWSVYSWLEGDDGWTRPVDDLRQAAIDLARFVSELQQIDATDGPRPGRHNNFRGEALSERDGPVRKAIDELGTRVDRRAVTRAWDLALDQPSWRRDLWFHADLQPGNLLSRHGRLTAVIDFGLAGVGDPACDLLPAWNLFTRRSRRIFRSELQVDDETWIRGQGWALYQALLALPYYWDTNQVMVRMAQREIHEILGDGA